MKSRNICFNPASKKHGSFFLIFFSTFLSFTPCYSSPITWFFPEPVKANNGDILTGSFTYDDDTNTVSDLNLQITRSGKTLDAKIVSTVTDKGFYALTKAVSGYPAASIRTVNLTNAGGSTTSMVAIGLSVLDEERCKGVSKYGTASPPISARPAEMLPDQGPSPATSGQ